MAAKEMNEIVQRFHVLGHHTVQGLREFFALLSIRYFDKGPGMVRDSSNDGKGPKRLPVALTVKRRWRRLLFGLRKPEAPAP